QRPRRARSQPVRGDAEPARGGRADRRRDDGVGLPPPRREGPVAALAALGLVHRDGDREPLLAGRARGQRRRDHRGARPLPAPAGAVAAGHGLSHFAVALDRVKQSYTLPVRRAAARSMAGLARTRVSPNALTTAGVLLCAVSAVLVFFEYRNEYLFYWLGAFV